jgi:Ca2+-binding RTX toxin-like protein
MANLTVSKTLLATNLSGIESPETLVSESLDASSALTNIDTQNMTFENQTIKGTAVTVKNPSYSSEQGSFRLNGSATVNFTDTTLSNISSANFKFSSFALSDSNGTLQIVGNLNGTANASQENINMAMSKLSYSGIDGSKWAVGGSFTYKYSMVYATGQETESQLINLTSFLASDSFGNSLGFTGKFQIGTNPDDVTGYMTGFNMKIGSATYSASGLKIDYETLKSVDTSSFNSTLDFLLTGNDVITMSDTDPIDEGVGGNRWFYAKTGNDKVNGSKYKDWIEGDEGNDTLAGLLGDDTLFGDLGNDSLDGGVGDDYLVGDEITISAIGGNDLIKGGDGKDLIFGGIGNDTLDGGTGDDSLYGEDGSVSNFSGNDVLNGGEGNDYLVGGKGIDKLTGGKGNDFLVISKSDFDFTSAKTVFADTITEFKYTATEQDFLLLDGFGDVDVFKTLALAKKAGSTAEVIYESGTGKFWYNEDGDSALIGALLFANAKGIPDTYWVAAGVM